MTGNEQANPMAPNRFRVCQCGCGEKLDKTKPHGKYVDSIHKQRAYRARKTEAARG